MKISIIIPNWNGAEKLARNLPEVLKAAAENKVAEVIVVDDASTDNSLEVLEKFSDIKLIKKSTNSGFSTTVNLGVKQASGDLVVQLNTDAKPWPNFLRFITPHFNDSQIFSVSCNVGGVWNEAEFKDGYIWHHQANVTGTVAKAHRTLWASGGSGVFRRELWLEFGGLDELFNPFYEEDMDLGYRATKRGYTNLWEPKSMVEHYKEKGVIATHFSQSRVSAVAQRNQLLFLWKNLTSPQLLAEHRQAVIKMMLKHPKYTKVVLAALLKLPQLQTKRQIEKRAAKLSDEEVLALFSN